jgi:hypothetical protein
LRHLADAALRKNDVRWYCPTAMMISIIYASSEGFDAADLIFAAAGVAREFDVVAPFIGCLARSAISGFALLLIGF